LTLWEYSVELLQDWSNHYENEFSNPECNMAFVSLERCHIAALFS